MTTHSPVEMELEKLKACIHCGFCLPACPTYKATGSEAESPRGRLYLLKHMLDQSLPAEKQLTESQVKPHLDQCLGCLACESACPSGVQYGTLLAASKSVLKPHESPLLRRLKRFIFAAVLPNRPLLNTLAFWTRLYQRFGIQRFIRALGLLRLMPPLAHAESLMPRIADYKELKPGMSFGSPEGERVALFTGCVMDTLYNEIHWDTVDALVANGYYVTIPEQTCCGALAHHSAEEDIALELARDNILAILKSNPDWIVVNSAGCGSTLKDYTHMLAENGVYAEKARVFSDITVDVMELLAKKPLKHAALKSPQTATYHAACHLHHAQGITDAPQAVLEQIEGLTLIPLTDAAHCCGSAGIYNLEQPELSDLILEDKTAHIIQTGAQTVVTGNPGCLLQIEKGLKEGSPSSIRVTHPVALVAEACRSEP